MAGDGDSPPLSAFQLPPGRQGLPPEQVAESQRWRLLGGAAEALVERGWVGIRVADIAAKAHVSRGTFYEHFDDLNDCLLAAYEMTADCIRDLAGADREGGGTGDLEAVVEEILRFLAAEPTLAHLLGAEAAAGAPPIAAARERLLDRLSGSCVDRRRLEGALAVVSERVAAGESSRLPELAPQLTRFIRGSEAPR